MIIIVDVLLHRLLRQHLANISASASAPSAMLDEDVGIERQPSPTYSRDVQIQEVQRQDCQISIYIALAMLLLSHPPFTLFLERMCSWQII